jgi:hypothetical protein
MRKEIVISLYDYTGEALKPWAEQGYQCYAFDIQHPKEGRVHEGICYQYADLHDNTQRRGEYMKVYVISTLTCTTSIHTKKSLMSSMVNV